MSEPNGASRVGNSGQSALASPNFGFLADHDPLLVQYASQAERYVFDDPNTALIKLRQFAELLAKQAAAYAGVYDASAENLTDVLDLLWGRGMLTREVANLFHGLRKAGNAAAHANAGTQREALHQLKMARAIAVWFHRSTKADPSFKAGPFIPPPDPAHVEQELKAALDRTRHELVIRQAELESVKLTTAREVQLRQEAEAKAKAAYEDLNTAWSLAQEIEAHLAAEQQRFDEQLAVLQAHAVSAPAAELVALLTTARRAGDAIDLDEADTRQLIDKQLRDAGWEADTEVLTYSQGVRPQKGRNVAIAEWPTTSGPADYALFVGLTPLAVVEAKRKRKDVAGAIGQSKRYSRDYQACGTDIMPGGPWENFRIPFLFATNGRPFLRQIAEKSGIWFHDARRPTNHPRPLEAWYTPEGLRQLLAQDIAAAEARLETEPTDYLPLRDYQATAVLAVEREIIAGKREILVAMATGTGKTITCIGLVYRLTKTKRFRRILFLVDRSALGEQATDKLKDVRLENLQTFPEIYDVKELGDLRPDPDTRLHIATVQGMVKRLLYPEDDAPPVPVDWYDCIVIDECHRGYTLDQEMSDSELKFRDEADYISKYRRVLDHFDAVRIGLTATPALHTTQIFGPPVYQYTYRQAVIDGWLTDHEPPYRLVTKLAEDGMKWQQGEVMKILDSRTSQLSLFQTPDEVEIEVDEFNGRVITENFNLTVCQALAEYIDPSLPGKTLVFCVNDLHADMVVRLLKDAFDSQYGPVHDDAVMKITGAADKPLQLIRRYKNEQLPKIAVTVDLLTTGIDVEEIVNLVFIRRVRSRILFEQMLGRATRLCPDLLGPGEDKERFRIFDAVGIYEALQNVSEMKPVVSRVNIPFTQLVQELCTIDDEDFRQQAKDQLLAKLRRKNLTDDQLRRFQAAAGMSRPQLITHVQATAPAPLGQWFTQRPEAVAILDEVYVGSTRFIISEHEDELRRVERGYGDATRPDDYLESFRRFIADHLNELPALIVVTQRPRDLSRSQLRELRLALDGAGFNEASLRTAWQETTNQDIAASIIGYIRHVACGQPLLSHRERVQAAMQKILASRSWTEPQRKWLERIGKQLEQEIVVDREALDAGQFKEMGGFDRLNKVFKGELDQILHAIADAMWHAAA